jgi:hypothetical protein
MYGGREVWPLIEGGKGVSATNHDRDRQRRQCRQL